MAISRNRDQKKQHSGASKYGTTGQTPDHDRVCSWANVSASALKLLVASVTANGDAVTLGTTRQGGLSLAILEGDDRYREYSSDVGDMEEKMGRFTDAALAAVPQRTREQLIELCRGD